MKLVDSGYKQRKLLFDLAADPWERNDLAAERPEEVSRLEQLLARWDEKNMPPRW